MTLVPFTAEALDELALQLLDLAGQVREMAVASRENEVTGFTLHANKVNEWLGHMDNWCLEGSGKLATAIEKQRGARRAQSLAGMTGVGAGKKRGRKRA